MLPDFAEDESGNVFTRAALPRRAENHWNEKWSVGHSVYLSIVARILSY
jgi:hypothetical protein